MKKITIWLVVIVVLLELALVVSMRYAKNMKRQYNTAMANIKSYDAILSQERDVSTSLQLTIDQLSSFQDSVLKELDATRKELKVKDSRLKALQAISTTFVKKDTVTLKDTIFKEPSFALDTLMQDEWYKLRLGLAYPSTIAVSPEFRSEKHVVVFSKKETVNPPKRFWLFRLFQRKHLVLQVDVVEKNPYIDNQQSRYIEIVK